MDDSLFFNIISNKVKCLNCGDIIESKYRHDYVTCKCGSISVDGGTSYFKRTMSSDARFDDMSESVKFTKEELLSFLNIEVSAYSRSAAIFFLKEWYNHDYSS